MKKQLPKTLLFVVLLFLVFLALQQLTSPAVSPVTPSRGEVDLAAVDLSQELVQISPAEWAFYPEQLYTPEDFAAGNTPAPTYGDSAGTADWGTWRLVVRLPPGRLYTVTGHSFHFSQRVYIDGQLRDEVGSPAATREETVPHTETFDYTFLAQEAETEFIFQAAGFHHRQRAGNSALVLGQPAQVNRYRALEFIQTSIVVGCLVTACLYFLGMFFFFTRSRQYLYLALAGLAVALRVTMTGEKHIMEIFPQLSWFVAIRAEYLCQALFVLFLLLFFTNLYPGLLHRNFVRVIAGLILAFCAAILFTDTRFFTDALPAFTAVWVVSSLVTLWQLVRRLRGGGLQTALVFTGFAAFVASALFDEVVYGILGVRQYNLLVIGVLVCVFMNMVALTLDFSEKEQEVTESRVAVMVSQIQPHFLYNSLGAIDGLCYDDPDKAHEAIITFSDYLRGNMDSLARKAPIPFEKELEHVRQYLWLEKLRFEEKLQVVYDIRASEFMLPALTLQPIVENAVRYGVTKKRGGGTVTIRAEETKRYYRITVIDDGAGFDPAEKKQDGRSHTGIDNVRARLEATSGGRLAVSSIPGRGTTAVIDIPKGRAGE